MTTFAFAAVTIKFDAQVTVNVRRLQTRLRDNLAEVT